MVAIGSGARVTALAVLTWSKVDDPAVRVTLSRRAPLDAHHF